MLELDISVLAVVLVVSYYYNTVVEFLKEILHQKYDRDPKAA